MADKFPKDRWIRDMLKKRYILVEEDGTLLRCVKADKDGVLQSSIYKPVTLQTHEPTGRVYFNATWRGFTKAVLANRIVAWAFHPNPENLPQVNHMDGDKQNNGPKNLEWSSGSDNEKHAHRTGLKTGRGSANSNAKLTAADITVIRQSQASHDEIAAQFGVSRSTIRNVILKKTWKHL